MAKKRTGKGGASAPPRDHRRELIRLALQQLQDRQGRLTPEIVVDAARDKASVLHDEFDWDDKAAAEKHRLDTARRLITYVTVFVVTHRRKVRVPTYVRDPRVPYKEQGYVSLGSAGLVRQDAGDIMVAEFDRCEAAIRRAQGVTEVLDRSFPGLSDELQSLLEQLIGIRTRVASGPKKGKRGESRPHA